MGASCSPLAPCFSSGCKWALWLQADGTILYAHLDQSIPPWLPSSMHLLASLLLQVGTVVAEDQMDDGTPLRLLVTIDRRDGSAVFDFEGE